MFFYGASTKVIRYYNIMGLILKLIYAAEKAQKNGINIQLYRIKIVSEVHPDYFRYALWI